MAKEIRRNERIRCSTLRLIDEDDNQIGIMDMRQALELARDKGLDLVEVSPNAKPPVCRIMDYGKWMYSQQKKDRKSKSHRHETKLKSITMKSPKIGEHDLMIKVNHAREFLEKGHRVQFSMRLRRRELAHPDIGKAVFKKIAEAIADVAKIDKSCRQEGRRITMSVTPTGKPIAPAPAPKPDSKQPKPAEKPQSPEQPPKQLSEPPAEQSTEKKDEG